MESMNHVSMDVEDDQALIKEVGLKCPRCESTNTKFDFYQNHQESQPHHYCKDCRRGWSVNCKLRDIPVGGGERKIRQQDVSMPDHTQKGLKCPCCESTNTKLAYYQNQNKSKPVHFCNDCLHYWMVAVGGTLWASPGERKRQQPETSVGDQTPMSQMALKMKCPRCESTNTNFVYYKSKNESMPVHFCKSCRRHWTVGGSLKIKLSSGGQMIKQQLKDSGLKASVEGLGSQGFSKERTECTQLLIPSVEKPQHLSLCLVESDNYIAKDTRGQKRDLEGSGEIASVEGCESNAASDELLEVIHTEYSRSFSPSVVAHQPVSVCLQKFDSRIEKDSEGFHFVDEVTPTEEVNLSDTSRSRESPEESNVVEHSSCGKKCNTFNAFGSNARGNEMAQLVSVDVATTINTQPNPEPLPIKSSLPFIKSSFMWPQVESMEVYRFMPQQPHFDPLEKQNEYLREGAALGLMLSFPKLVEVTREAQLEDSRSVFDTKLKAVQIFEEYGFTVEPIRTQLVRLLQIKESCEQHNCMLKTATQGLTEVLESIALLEKDLQLLQEKKEREAFKVDELQRTSDQFKESILAARLKFHTLVAAPW